LSVTLSFETREQKFCIQTPHINAKIITKGIFEILFWGCTTGFFLGQTIASKRQGRVAFSEAFIGRWQA